ncbi:MAG: hypothetical protein H0W99_04935, partial [Acidobacteria bacterium]|nr:hypothetical protein [Acidobacteriota bacterium]
MALFEGKTPSERNKLIAAIVLGALALMALSYMFFGSSFTPKRIQNTNSRATGVTQTTTTTSINTTNAVASPDQVRKEAELAPPHPIVFEMSSPAVP